MLFKQSNKRTESPVQEEAAHFSAESPNTSEMSKLFDEISAIKEELRLIRQTLASNDLAERGRCIQILRELETLKFKEDAAKDLIFRLGGNLETEGYAKGFTRPPDEIAPAASNGNSGIRSEIIVSLTSYPARVRTLPLVIGSILQQTVLPDRIILWLGEEQFPLKENELPADLLSMKEKGLEIKWCDDLKAHKKYYYAALENPESILITIDDDMVYDPYTIEKLIEAHHRFPEVVCARRVKKAIFTDKGKLKPYASWPLQEEAGVPSLDLVPTGVGGVLYPPGVLQGPLMDKTMLMELCPNSDDMWLKTIQLVKGIPAVLSDNDFIQNPVSGTQGTSLFAVEQALHRNDKDLNVIVKRMNEQYPELWSHSKMSAGKDGMAN